ncbi:hypothetical protein BKA80DRAFT_122610 [Phyllosticta citrichinensis]
MVSGVHTRWPLGDACSRENLGRSHTGFWQLFEQLEHFQNSVEASLECLTSPIHRTATNSQSQALESARLTCSLRPTVSCDSTFGQLQPMGRKGSLVAELDLPHSSGLPCFCGISGPCPGLSTVMVMVGVVDRAASSSPGHTARQSHLGRKRWPVFWSVGSVRSGQDAQQRQQRSKGAGQISGRGRRCGSRPFITADDAEKGRRRASPHRETCSELRPTSPIHVSQTPLALRHLWTVPPGSPAPVSLSAAPEWPVSSSPDRERRWPRCRPLDRTLLLSPIHGHGRAYLHGARAEDQTEADGCAALRCAALRCCCASPGLVAVSQSFLVQPLR